MGTNKALLKLGNEQMLTRLLREFSGLDEVLISAGEQRGEYERFGAPVVYDERREIGPMEGIRRLLTEARGDYVFVVAADMPFVNRALLSYLTEFLSSDYDAFVLADEEHIQPLCAIYHKRILPVFEEAIREGNYRIRTVLNRVRTKYVPLNYSCFDKKIVRNINTRKEYEELREPCVFAVSGYSDSGKTFLIEKLINEFIREGYRTAVIKHDGHDSLKDAPGSDTERFAKAGAVLSCVFSDSALRIQEQKHTSDEQTVKDLLAYFASKEPPPRMILLEGFKESSYPKIWVGEGAPSNDTVLCIAADEGTYQSADRPVFRREDVNGILQCVKEHFGLD